MTKILIFIITLLLTLSGCSSELETLPPEAGETDSPVSIELTERLGFQGGNIGAGGLVCGGDDGYVYYRSESDGWQLYRAKPDGTEKFKISGHMVENINVLDGWVYFIDHQDGNAIRKIRTDGTGETKLVDGWCWNLYVADSGIYFDRRDENNAPHVYRADTEGGNLILLVPDRMMAYYYQDRVYYSNTDELGVLNTLTGEMQTLVTGYTHNVVVDDSGIYYWEVNAGEFRMLEKTGETDQLILEGGDQFNYCEENLYYTGIDSNPNGPCHRVYQLNTKTQEQVALLEEANEYFDSLGNWQGITFQQLQEHPETIDSALFDSMNGELKDSYNESVGYVYCAFGHLYMRASLRESLVETGRVDCIVRLDDGVTIWD